MCREECRQPSVKHVNILDVDEVQHHIKSCLGETYPGLRCQPLTMTPRAAIIVDSGLNPRTISCPNSLEDLVAKVVVEVWSIASCWAGMIHIGIPEICGALGEAISNGIGAWHGCSRSHTQHQSQCCRKLEHGACS